MKIAAIGRSQMLHDAIIRLAEKGHTIVSITTAPAASDYSRTETDFEALADKLQCPFKLTRTADKAIPMFKGADIAISVNWVSVLEDRHIKTLPMGILNAHAGDLPSYRGNACPNWAILNGEKTVGLCVHSMEGGQLDCGRIVAKACMPLDKNTYISDINDWMDATVPELFQTAIERLAGDPDFVMYVTRPGDGFRCYPRLPENGLIDWNAPVQEIHALIRACSRPLDCAYTYCIKDSEIHRLHIVRARIASAANSDMAHPGHVLKNDPTTGQTHVRCGDGVLAIEECFYHGGKSFTPGTAWQSIRMRLGANAEDMLWLRKGK